MNRPSTTPHLTAAVRMAMAFAALCCVSIAVAQPATDAQVEGTTSQSELKWKPHRVATAAPAPTADSTAAANGPTTPEAAISPLRKLLPPATVGLPAGVPSTSGSPAAMPSPAPADYAPLRGTIAKSFGEMGDWFTMNRANAAQASTAAPQSAGPSLERFMRTPQGDAGRPIMARETGPGMTQPIAATAPLGGGLAPRYNPAATAGRPANSRPDRLAMNNIDSLPSVMTRAPQAAAIDENAVPGRLPAASDRLDAQPAPRAAEALPTPNARVVDPPIVIETTPMDMNHDLAMPMGPGMDGMDGMGGMETDPTAGMWMGQYPAEMHLESFYDDPYACDEEGGFLPCHCCDGRICAWMRQFGKPYYGWRWYRDFSASAGVTSFQNETNLGLLGNYGVNEYLNWSMPFWNAFGVGWQLGARGVQSNFQSTSVTTPAGTTTFNARDQVFVTTGFFTRAFQGRGLQGGAVYDYLQDNYFENVNVSQLRAEMSYVWGYHELGFWGAFNVGEQNTIFGPVTRSRGEASTLDLYTAFYRLQFGDANEWKVWGGATAQANGIVGSSLRAPLNRSLALDGTFTYLIPGESKPYELHNGSMVTTAPGAWNVSVNIVYYPARRARRSLASPYRPLFEVADNGSMIRSLSRQ